MLLVNGRKRFEIGDDITEILIVEVPEYLRLHDDEATPLVVHTMPKRPHPVRVAELRTRPALSRRQVG